MIKTTPFDLAQKILYLDGKPFDLKEREYLRPIYNSPVKRHIFKFSRQAEKSTTLAASMVINGVAIPNHRTLYVSPVSRQSRVFSSDRLRSFLESPFIKKHFINKDSEQAVFRKTLSNGSRFNIEYCFLTPDRIRGLSSDRLYVDEIQDIQTDFIPVIEETVSHSNYKIFNYAGTPKSAENSIEYFWERSTQRELATKCSHCNYWNMGLFEVNMGKEGLICARCKGSLTTEKMEWVRAYPLEKFHMEGWHLNALQTPWNKDWKEILIKKELYPPSRFYNEVLGLPYDSGSKPITLQELMACCAERGMDEANGRYSSPMFAGIDYGLFGEAGKTVLCIGYFSPYPEKFKVVYAKIYDKALSERKIQMDEIIKTCRTFNVSVIGADFGVAGESNIQLATEFGADRVIQFFHTGNQNERIKYNQKRWMYTLNRTFVMTDLFLDLKHRKIEFFRWDEFRPFGEHILNIYSDIRESFQKEMMYFDHRPDKNDDFFHSLLYCKLAAGIFYEGRAI